MKIGICQDTNEEYHQCTHIGSTSLKQMSLSPGHFFEAWKGPKKESKAFDEGSAVHSVILEQSLDGFARRPDGVDGRTKEGKQILADLEATGKKVLTADVFDSLERRLHTFVSSTESMKVYNGAEIEKSHYAKDPETGLYIKARPDMYKPGMICDFKTTQSMRMFENQVWSLGYFVQCGFYSLVTELTTGSTVKEFKFIAQEKSAPYGLRVFRFDESKVNFCKQKARELLNRAAVAIDGDEFPLYDDIVKDLSVPGWVTSDEFSFEEVG